MQELTDLALASVQGAILGLLGLLLFRLHRRMGQVPLLFLLGLLGLLVPLTASVRATTPDLLDPRVAVVPVFVTLSVMVYATLGWRTGHLVALIPLGAGILLGTLSIVDAFVPTFLPESWLGPQARIPLVEGTSLWLATVVALLSYHLALTSGWRRVLVAPFLISSLMGATIHTALANGFLVALGGSAGAPWTALGTPAAMALSPALAVGLGLELHLMELPVALRRDLLDRRPAGREALSERYMSAQARQAKEEQAQREKASTYVDLLESSPEGAYVCQPGGRITYANPAMANLLDRPNDDLTGSNIRHLLAHRDERGRPVPWSKAAMPGRHRTAVPLPNGHTRLIEVTVRRGGGDVLHGRVRDLTEQYLRHQLARQKERAEFYVDLLRHDIGNHVSVPLLHLEMLASREDLDERARRQATSALTAMNEAAELLDRVDLLRQADAARPEPMDATSLLRSVVEHFQTRHPEATIELDLPGEPVGVKASALLKDALVNLVGNALRHAGPQAHIVVGAHRQGDQWVLRVDDDGPGVQDELKEAIFDRTVRDESAGGKGLGLYIVETVARALGGKALVADRVEGEPEKGASFRLLLDLVELHGDPADEILADDPLAEDAPGGAAGATA